MSMAFIFVSSIVTYYILSSIKFIDTMSVRGSDQVTGKMKKR
jgi:hypothetical protein